MAHNPYRGLDEFHFWSRAVAWPAPGQLDPMLTDHPIAAGERVVTIGSCFAQHLARNMAGLGLRYHVTEAAPDGMPAEEAQRRNYGVFSARFGNVYTVRQAVQLYDRAFGRFDPEDDIWEVPDGFVDAFRPQIEPVPYATAAQVRAEAGRHLACVREMFTSADWLIFTLGLTEGWRSVHDGAVYPVVPGVSGGVFDAGHYEFVNFSAQSVQRDLQKFVDRVQSTNPRCRIILTVSPVPLIATYEDRHVLVATTYSKSVLRVAADEIERAYSHVTYFPSYEIITSPAAGGRYFADDLRSVREEGVQHVMRIFRKHFVTSKTADRETAVTSVLMTDGDGNGHDRRVICDEEAIEASIRNSGIAIEPAVAPHSEAVALREAAPKSRLRFWSRKKS